MDSTTSNTSSKVTCILFVGSNPSKSSLCDAAFHSSTKSSKTLTSWVANVQGLKIHVNVLNKKTEDNRPLKTSEIKLNLDRLQRDINSVNPDRIVAVGKTAAKALTLLRQNFYELPHPSGRNRLLNDKNYIEEKIKGLEEYCNSTNPILNSKLD